jgi:hypothetical protein
MVLGARSPVCNRMRNFLLDLMLSYPKLLLVHISAAVLVDTLRRSTWVYTRFHLAEWIADWPLKPVL